MVSERLADEVEEARRAVILQRYLKYLENVCVGKTFQRWFQSAEESIRIRIYLQDADAGRNELLLLSAVALWRVRIKEDTKTESVLAVDVLAAETTAKDMAESYRQMSEYVQLVAKQRLDTDLGHSKQCACAINRALRLQMERAMEDFVYGVMMEKRSKICVQVAMTRLQRRRLFGIFRKFNLFVRIENSLHERTKRRIDTLRLRHECVWLCACGWKVFV